MTTSFRIHLFGASGSGTTTLGRALAETLEVPHLDADDYYWKPSDPPYRIKNSPAQRVRLIERRIAGHAGWVLSGSLCSWGDPLLHRFTLALFLHRAAERLARLAVREQQRHGGRIGPGGDMRRQHEEFMAWAASYDTSGSAGRSLTLHEQWLKRLPCPVMRLDSAASVESLVASVMEQTGETA